MTSKKLSKTTSNKYCQFQFKNYNECALFRDVAQLGSALPWGGRGRQFKSDRSDQKKENCSLRGTFLYIDSF